jgi:diguanylate cyclase (GGDEF)-like protein
VKFESLTPTPALARQQWLERLQQSWLLRNIALLLLWLLVYEIGWLVEYTNHASVWYPVAGLTFAALLLFGFSILPALLTGCVLITFYTAYHYKIALSTPQLLNAGLLFGLAHILPYALGAIALRSFAKRGPQDISRIIVLFLVIAAVSSFCTTWLALPALVVTDMMPAEEVVATWLPFWIGDMAGVMVLAPFFVGLLSRVVPDALFRLTDMAGLKQHQFSSRYLLKLLLNMLLLTFCMLLAKVTDSPNSAFAIFFLVIPHMWIACSESALLNVSSVALSSFLIAFLVHVLGLMDYVMVYQFAINVIAANTLFGLAIPTLLADNLQLRKVAFTDGLTQVASRDRLEQRAVLEIMRSQQEQYPMSLMVFDIDYFKRINDEFGHHVGDQALQQLAKLAQLSLRPSDLLGRFGGDEFVVLLPQANCQAAVLIAERILEQLQQVYIADVHQLTASFGVAELAADEDYEQLFRRADRALYQAKVAGRNQVSVAAATATA